LQAFWIYGWEKVVPTDDGGERAKFLNVDEICMEFQRNLDGISEEFGWNFGGIWMDFGGISIGISEEFR